MTKEKLTEEERQKGMKYAVYEGASASAMYAISGSFLTLFALALGANNFMIGLVVALPALVAAFSYIAVAYFIESYGNRKKVCVIASFLSRVMWIFVGLVPYLFTGNVLWLIFFATIASFFGTFVSTAWASMMGDIIPENIRGGYFGRRNRICAIASLITTILCGIILDNIKGMLGFTIIFLLAGIFGILTTFYFKKFPEIKSDSKKIDIGKDVKNITTDEFFLPFVIMIFVWQLGFSFSNPFINIYIIKNLGASYAWISTLIVISGISSILVQKQWGSVSDHFGHGSILKFTAFATGIIPLLWFFAPSVEYGILINIFSGIVFAGFNLAVFNYVLQLSPPARRELYYAFYLTIVTFASIISPIIAGSVAEIYKDGFFSGLRLVLYLSFGIHLFASVLFMKYLKELPYKEISVTQLAEELIRLGSSSIHSDFKTLGEKIKEKNKIKIEERKLINTIKNFIMNLIKKFLRD